MEALVGDEAEGLVQLPVEVEARAHGAHEVGVVLNGARGVARAANPGRSKGLEKTEKQGQGGRFQHVVDVMCQVPLRDGDETKHRLAMKSLSKQMVCGIERSLPWSNGAVSIIIGSLPASIEFLGGGSLVLVFSAGERNSIRRKVRLLVRAAGEEVALLAGDEPGDGLLALRDLCVRKELIHHASLGLRAREAAVAEILRGGSCEEGAVLADLLEVLVAYDGTTPLVVEALRDVLVPDAVLVAEQIAGEKAGEFVNGELLNLLADGDRAAAGRNGASGSGGDEGEKDEDDILGRHVVLSGTC